ncbi:hypothetical protein ACTWPT_17520 [Nonomuraea sp. 3N208]|uniref:hypothetical protein n=1 Tax=Nonomuraea sp. 3N208 TaxID=3457421 RepID=UPI003FCE7314
MTRGLLLVSLAVGALTAPPAPASAAVSTAATELAIRAITVRPAEPVVGAQGSVRLVVDVVAKGARPKNGVTVKVEPGAPPGPVLASKPPVMDPSDPSPSIPAPSPSAPVPAPSGATQPGSLQPNDPIHSLGPSGQPSQNAGPIQNVEPLPGRGPVPRIEPVPGSEPVQGVAAPAPRPIEGGAPAVQDGSPKLGTQPAAGPALPPRLVWRLAASPPARMADGWETWRFLPDKRLSRFYPAGAWTVTATARGTDGTTVTEYASFQLKRETKLSEVQAERVRGAVRVRGSLTRVDPRGLTDFGPFDKQPLEIMWRRDDAADWERVGETTTDAAGAFAGTILGRSGGHWRVRYAGTGHYAPDVSKSQQIAQ